MTTLAECIKWRDAAIADGWAHEPTYGESESEERACRLRREGHLAQVYTRPENGYSVGIWGPDKLAIEPIFPYYWPDIVHGVHICDYCGEYFEKTVRIGFAGRCCPECRLKHLAEVEYRGWAD